MKEATGEGSMTIITIIIIVGLITAATIIVGVMVNSANNKATESTGVTSPDYCTSIGKTYNATTKACQ